VLEIPGFVGQKRGVGNSLDLPRRGLVHSGGGPSGLSVAKLGIVRMRTAAAGDAAYWRLIVYEAGRNLTWRPNHDSVTAASGGLAFHRSEDVLFFGESTGRQIATLRVPAKKKGPASLRSPSSF
jgi:hypothetical protein